MTTSNFNYKPDQYLVYVNIQTGHTYIVEGRVPNNHKYHFSDDQHTVRYYVRRTDTASHITGHKAIELARLAVLRHCQTIGVRPSRLRYWR